MASLEAQRRLGDTSSALSKTYERLSSGLRINTASDDAAGLAVVSSLKAETRIYSQGVRNLNDGISALNIADAAIENLSSIVVRLQELAEQSANGTCGLKQRQSLDAEAQALAKEYFRISRTTEFNGLALFDGTIQGLSLQAGFGNDGRILSSLGGTLGTGTFGAALSCRTESGTSTAIYMADINGDGVSDLVTAGSAGAAGYATICLGNGDGTFGAGLSYQTESGAGSSSQAIYMSDLNGDGVLDLVTAGRDGTNGRATIRLGNADGTFRAALSYQTESSSSTAVCISDVDGDGILDLVTAGNDGTNGRATIRLGNGDGTFGAALSYQTESTASYALCMADVNRDGVVDLVTAGDGIGAYGATIRLGNGDGTFRAALSCQTETGTSFALCMSDVNGDGIVDLVTAGADATSGRTTIRLGNGDGTFRAALSYQTEGNISLALSMSDINGDGVLDLATSGANQAGWDDGCATIRLGNGDGTFGTSICYLAESSYSHALFMSDINGDGVLDLVTAGRGDVDGRATIRLSKTKDGISPILEFTLKTQADSLQALPIFKHTLDRLEMQRGIIGSFQSRLSSALSTLGSTILEYKNAQSRTEDADITQESATLVRQQILQQAASSVLAQANQAPALALMLLKR